MKSSQGAGSARLSEVRTCTHIHLSAGALNLHLFGIPSCRSNPNHSRTLGLVALRGPNITLLNLVDGSEGIVKLNGHLRIALVCMYSPTVIPSSCPITQLYDILCQITVAVIFLLAFAPDISLHISKWIHMEYSFWYVLKINHLLRQHQRQYVKIAELWILHRYLVRKDVSNSSIDIVSIPLLLGSNVASHFMPATSFRFHSHILIVLGYLPVETTS